MSPDPSIRDRPPARRRAQTAIFVTVLLDLLGFGMILPILPFYAQEYGASELQIGWLFASFSLAQLVFAPLLGKLSDRTGRRPVLLASIAASVVAHALFAFAGSFEVLLVARFASGLAASNFGLAQAYLADVTPRAERSQAMGLVGAAFGLGFVLGPAFGGLLSLASTRAVPLGAAALAAANLVLAASWLPESLTAALRRRSREARWFDPRRLGQLARDTPLLGLMLLLFVFTLCLSLMEATLALFLQARLGFGDTETSWLFVFIGIVMVGVQGGLIGIVVRRFGERRVIPVGMAVMAAGLLLLGQAEGLVLLGGAAALLALGAGLHNPSLLGLLSQLAGEESQGGILGLSRSFGSLARVLGPLAGTWIFQRLGPPWPFRAGGVLLLLALAGALVLMHRLGERAAATPGGRISGEVAAEAASQTAE
ncbi:MAG TPA: MFS transporter [Thermoanaerobaculia bacterium]|nr:MFS transporter [Thermoanaerobaculia bacterium]